MGVASPLPAEPLQASSAPRHKRTRSPAIASEISAREARSSACSGLLGFQGPRRGGSPTRRCSSPGPGDRLRGARPAPAPSPPGWRKTTGAGPLPPLRQLPPPWLGGGPCATIPVPRGLGGGGPEPRPAGAGALAGLCTARAGCGAPGALPALRLYRACHLGSRVQGRATARPSLGARGKMISRPSGQEPPRDWGSRMNSGRDPHGKSEFCFVFRRIHACPFCHPYPHPHPGRSREGHISGLSFTGVPSWHPGGRRH